MADPLHTAPCRRTIRRSLWTVALASALLPAAAPQSGTGSIAGLVRDPSGAAVPGAAILVENTAIGLRRNLKSDGAGLFSVPALDPVEGYSLKANKPGFAESELTGIDVLVGMQTSVEIVLSISPERTKVSVEEAPPIADQTRTGLAGVVRGTQILNLPVNGRRVDSYALMTPAVAPDGVLGLISFRGMAGGNSFLTDGNDTSNQYFHENAGRTRISTQISQDAVQEFQVLSTGYSAEFGRASGGIINTVTRSGSNRLSGTAYLFFRNRALNARDPYSAINPPERRTQAGASIGGPARKDALFYFFNVELHRRDYPLVSSLGRAPLFDRDGNFIGTCGAGPQQCAAARGFLQRQFQVLPRRADSDLAFGRLDWVASDRNHFSASFNYLKWVSPNGFQTQATLNNGEGVGANGNSSVRTRYGRLAWRSIPSSTRVNEFRFGWFKDRHADNLNPLLIPPETGLVSITVQGQPNLGVSADLPRLDPSENRFEIADTLTALARRHSWKLGFNIVHTRDFVRYLRNRNGSYEYPDFTSFALDFSGNTSGARRWQTYSQRFGNELYNQAIRDYDWFVADQYRVNSFVTLNYGLRHEFSVLPQPGQGNPEYPQSSTIPSTKTNFAPRFGVAVGFNRSRSVLRAGYGIFYARYHSGVVGTFFQENGTSQRSVQLEGRFLSESLAGPVFPDILSASPKSLPKPGDAGFDSTIDLTFPSPDFRNPYTEQGDIGIEHAFTSTVNAAVSYLWSRALHLTTVRDLNIGVPGAPVTYSVLDARGEAVGTFATPGYRLVNRVNPNWRRVNSVESGGNSYYNALVIQVRKRISAGFEGFAAYTWSHAIDYNQGGGAENIFFADGPRSYANGDYRGEKASSQLDQRHRLVLSSSWEPAWARRAGGVGRALFVNWRFSQISTFASPQAATPAVLVVGVPFPGAAFNSTINGFGGSTRVPFYPAASLKIDSVIRTDARLTRILRLNDRAQLHLNCEAFNVLNHVSDTAVNTVAFEARAGVLRPAPHAGEGVASQGYPDGTNARRAQLSVRVIW